jgi:predicted MFS family arabinose efflux permease
LATQTIQPILPLYITEKGATTLELGIIISLLSFTAIAAKIPLGLLSEKIGRWPVIPAVAVGQTVSLLLYSIVPNSTWFYPIRIFHAFTLAAFAPTALAIAHDLAPPGKRGDTIGKFLTSFGAATTFGPFLCTFLVNYVDYVQLFQVASVIPLLGLAPFLLIRREGSRVFSHGKTSQTLSGSLRAIVSSRNMLVLSYLRLSFSFTYAFFITLFAVHAQENLLFVSSLIALFFGVKGIMNMLSRIPSGKLADKVGYKFPIVLAFVLLSMAFLTISETSNIYLLICAMVIYGVAHGMRAVSEWSMLGDCAPSEASNIATAYLSTMFNVGEALGAVAAGALSIIFNIQAIFKLASFIVFTGVFAVTFMQTKNKSS